MRLFLHIGTEKTGTSSIQSFLHINGELLVKNGFATMRSFEGISNRALPAYAMNRDRSDEFHLQRGLTSPKSRVEFERSIERSVHRELTALSSKTHTLLVSSEHLHSRIHKLEEVNRVLALFRPHCDEIRILCYLRPQLELAISQYSTVLRNGEVRSLEPWLQGTLEQSHYFRFDQMLLLWAEGVGREYVTPLFYDKKELIQSDVIRDYIARTGLPDLDYQFPPRKNRSISRKGQFILRMLNRVAPRRQNERFSSTRKNINLVMNRWFAGTGALPSPELAMRLQAQYEEPNARLKEYWFPDREMPDSWRLPSVIS
jgi:hypothetical protein